MRWVPSTSTCRRRPSVHHKADSVARRSCQTALYHIAEALVRWMAPILSFTADEVWGYLPGEREKYVFTGE
ncbi:class I tRNA ligase family protein [Escherichia coli]